ncbi:hypothetical protein C2S51_014138 [Perilla frutescens var. frutescens]|nr:hypothetical protein C2S51_014138 [Perilla frutescens var. frutescens]
MAIKTRRGQPDIRVGVHRGDFKVTLYDSDNMERQVLQTPTRRKELTSVMPHSFAALVLGQTEIGGFLVWVCMDVHRLLVGKKTLQLQWIGSDRVWDVNFRLTRMCIKMGDGWASFANVIKVDFYETFIFTSTDNLAKFIVSVFSFGGVQRVIRMSIEITSEGYKFKKKVKKHTSTILHRHLENNKLLLSAVHGLSRDTSQIFSGMALLRCPASPMGQRNVAMQWAGSERVWDVKFRLSATCISMDDGWAGFVHEMQVGHFGTLIFTPTDDWAKFIVSVFSLTRMQRRVQCLNAEIMPGGLKFVKEVKKHTIAVLDIPVEWIRATGLRLPKRMLLQNCSGGHGMWLSNKGGTITVSATILSYPDVDLQCTFLGGVITACVHMAVYVSSFLNPSKFGSFWTVVLRLRDTVLVVVIHGNSEISGHDQLYFFFTKSDRQTETLAVKARVDAKLRTMVEEHLIEKKRFKENAMAMLKRQELEHAMEMTRAEIKCLEASLAVLRMRLKSDA